MNIHEYIRSFLKYDNPILPDLEIQEKTMADTRSFIEPEIGKLIGLIIRMIKAKKVLELGTCIGYSGIWIAEALKETGGRLTTIDYDIELLKEAEINIKKAGLHEIIDIIPGDILDVVDKLEENSFDIILQDSKKTLYPELLEKCVKLIRKNGLIIADDTLYMPKDLPEKLSSPLHRYNELIFNDSRFYSTILPIGDGITLSVKI